MLGVRVSRRVRQARQWRTNNNTDILPIHNKQTGVERLNGRLKAHRRLNSVRVRGRFKVRIHAMMSVIVCQVRALATGSRRSLRKAA